MSGSGGDIANTDEASEPIDTSISRADTFADRARETASQAREKIASRHEPDMSDAVPYGALQFPRREYLATNLLDGVSVGQTKASSRRLSDTPTSVRDQTDGFDLEAAMQDLAEESMKKSNSMLQTAQETVAKALGGASRGAD
ncbi:uncharacterized protein N7459_001792 [Penicillium hispanicum]|uniref:uncharacterized protein n=1 Tax=Penicillium hispanicum TaxID=1080232 RepID=UPI002540CB5B|nr:uncharacterized protein N7459_001792 [Penicillium hispanicum]KAJ5595584.1 hypothetical protein N7459_001792 [Penicillium hispanicum]